MEKTGCEKGQSNPLALLKILEKEIRLANDQKITLEYLIQRGINEAIPNDKKMAREVKSRMELMICECLPQYILEQEIGSEEIDEFINQLLENIPSSEEDLVHIIRSFQIEPLDYSDGLDTFYLIADRDPQSFKSDQYDTVLQECAHYGVLFCPSNPTFELWLLLHYRPVLENEINLHAENRKSGRKGEKKRRYTEAEVRKFIPGYSKKKNALANSNILNKLPAALENVSSLPTDPEKLKTSVGTAIPLLIQDMGWKPQSID